MDPAKRQEVLNRIAEKRTIEEQLAEMQDLLSSQRRQCCTF